MRRRHGVDGDEVDENIPLAAFSDSGSSDDEKEMVHSTSDIPDGDEVDENITQNVALAACSCCWLHRCQYLSK